MGQIFYTQCPKTPDKDQFKNQGDAERRRQAIVRRFKLGKNTHYPNYSYRCRIDKGGCGYWHNGTRPHTKARMTRQRLIEAGIIQPGEVGKEVSV